MLDWKTLMNQQETSATGEELKARVIDVLRSIYDPEIPVNIYDLGLIYGLDISPQGEVQVRMTLTAPNCPVAQTFPDTVKEALLCVGGVSDAQVELVWDPPWSRDNMTEAARLQLGMF
jgi:FeS assembly SUF system protein